LHNVKIAAQHGLTIAYADVSGKGVTIDAGEGRSISMQAGAKVSLHRSSLVLRQSK
jgi:hypothetical protein